MMRPAGTLAIGLAVLLGPACGKKGPLELPPPREPMAVEGLKAFQRGGRVILEWTNPSKFADGRPLDRLDTFEIWIVEGGAGSPAKLLRPEDARGRARLAVRVSGQEFSSYVPEPGVHDRTISFPLSLSEAGAGEKPLAFAVRVLDAKRRPSNFAPAVSVEVRPAPGPPAGVGLRVREERVEITWDSPLAEAMKKAGAAVSGYNIYRSEGSGRPRKLNPSPVPGPPYEDRAFEFGRKYTYVVRSCAAGTEPCLESDDSEPRSVVPEDIFPPAAPSGLVAVSGTDVVSLSWSPAAEDDAAGYLVWRREEDVSEFSLLSAGLVPETLFTDTPPQRGKSYVYAVSVRDRRGNEGPKTATGPVRLKEKGA